MRVDRSGLDFDFGLGNGGPAAGSDQRSPEREKGGVVRS
jgi:hypothetical protein